MKLDVHFPSRMLILAAGLMTVCGILIAIYGVLNIIDLCTGYIDPKKEEV